MGGCEVGIELEHPRVGCHRRGRIAALIDERRQIAVSLSQLRVELHRQAQMCGGALAIGLVKQSHGNVVVDHGAVGSDRERRLEASFPLDGLTGTIRRMDMQPEVAWVMHQGSAQDCHRVAAHGIQAHRQRDHHRRRVFPGFELLRQSIELLAIFPDFFVAKAIAPRMRVGRAGHFQQPCPRDPPGRHRGPIVEISHQQVTHPGTPDEVPDRPLGHGEPPGGESPGISLRTHAMVQPEPDHIDGTLQAEVVQGADQRPVLVVVSQSLFEFAQLRGQRRVRELAVPLRRAQARCQAARARWSIVPH